MAAALALILAGCAGGDESGDTGAAAVTTGVPTVLVVDASASMLIDDAPGPRIDAARAAADGLIEALPNDAVLGLVTYGTSTDDSPASQAAGCRDVTTLADPGDLGADGNRETLARQVAGLSPSGYTPIAESLRQAAGLLPDGDTAVIVISDGEDSCGDPPCEAAAELREQNPGLRISTVGFKTATPELACIARTTDGLFVTADNADQLASRLLAARNVDQNASALTPTGLGGIDVGAHFDDIVGAHADFPDQSAGTAEGENIVITYIDCDYVFDRTGTVVEVRPHSGRTVDGLAVGDRLSRAVDLYGEEVDPSDLDPEWTTSSDSRFYTASREAGTAWKIASDGDAITSITLCLCLPGTGASGTSGSGSGSEGSRKTTTQSGQTEIVTYRPYLDDGSLAPQMPLHSRDSQSFGCQVSGEFYSCGQYATDASLFLCSVNPQDRPVCPVIYNGELRFVEGGLVQMLPPSGYKTLPTSGPVPMRVYLQDGLECRIGFQPGGGRAGYRTAYTCQDGSKIWHRDGGAGFDTSGGTWTARIGDMNGAGLSTVSISRVEILEK